MQDFKRGEIKTEALVLRRTKYGEFDRILSLITPEGKRSVLAKGVRKESSRLAGGVEMFSLSEIVLHQGRGELAILTSAKSKKFFKKILVDIERLEAAGEILKKISKSAEIMDESDFFDITKQSLEALDGGAGIELILTWFYLNLARVEGEQINLVFDQNGERLKEGAKYSWDSTEKQLVINKCGKISTNEIKMMRLMLSNRLNLVQKVRNGDVAIGELLFIAKSLNQI